MCNGCHCTAGFVAAQSIDFYRCSTQLRLPIFRLRPPLSARNPSIRSSDTDHYRATPSSSRLVAAESLPEPSHTVVRTIQPTTQSVNSVQNRCHPLTSNSDISERSFISSIHSSHQILSTRATPTVSSVQQLPVHLSLPHDEVWSQQQQHHFSHLQHDSIDTDHYQLPPAQNDHQLLPTAVPI